MRNPLQKYLVKMAIKEGRWIDKTIKKNVPEWKLRLLKRFNKKLMRKFLNVNLEFSHQDLITDFGHTTSIRLNGKVIGEMEIRLKFKNE